MITKESIASHYIICGYGIEIGALHKPLLIPNTNIKYVDRMSKEDLMKHYDVIPVDVDIVDNGETLSKIENDSQDFIIANHFLEHCENTIGTIKNFLRVLKIDGIIFLSIPDQRYSVDKTFPITSLKHIIDDYIKGPEISKEMHVNQWINVYNNIKEELMNESGSIHYHTWLLDNILYMFLYIKKTLPFEILFSMLLDTEMVFVFKKI